ncbi:replication initiation protein [Helicobacter pylori]|uniref:replication initiation protein n=2 Tax=Helicobacter pylori TaxID=210 RepID=UPI0009A3D563|nr:replication initiation protein [Helicobacter pylori]OPG51146.1 replication A protein [Helicobacter pylori]QEF42877.1 replication initiation protein [Helicobacter pylori]
MPMNTNFEQLRKQELELRKLLEELDTLPQTPQIKLQKQKIQTYIDKITPSILSGFNQKFKEITEKLPNEFEKEKPTPTKEPQTTPTPCKDLVVSTPKDKTYITYYNNANKVNLGNLSEREANLLFAIFQKLKDQGNTLIRFEPQDLKRMLGIKISYDNLTRTARSMWNKIKTADFWEVRDIIVNGRECVSEKNYMLFQVCEIVSDKETREFLYMDIQLNTGYNYLLNNLGMGGQYTSFNLLEFQRVRGKYAKTLYRLLKQYKSTGILSVEWSQFRELLDIPKDYKMENIDQKVLTPAIKELHKIYPFEHLSYKKERRSHDKRKVTHIDFYFEQLPQGETKKQKQADKQRAKRDIKLIAWDIKRQGMLKRSKETLEVREMDLKSLIGSLFENPNGAILKIENIAKEKNQFFMHISFPNRKSEPQKIPISDKRYALEFLYVSGGYTFKKDNLLQEIETFTPNIHPITNEPIKEFAEYVGKTINITNFNVDQFPDGITSYLKITNIVKLNDNQIQISIQDVDKPDKLLKPFIAKDEKHLKNWFKKYYR